jgi:hypothetical protein
MGFETNGTKVVTRGEPDVSIEGSRQTPKQRDGGLGAAFFNALDVIGRHARTHGEVGDIEAKGDPAIVDGLTESQRFTDRNAFRVLRIGFSPHPAGVGTSHHSCLS